jgi:hypothetical protein
MRTRIIRCENRDYFLRTSQKSSWSMYQKFHWNGRWSLRWSGVIRSKSVDRQTRKNNQQGRPNRDDTLGTDTETPEADLKSMTHGAALH